MTRPLPLLALAVLLAAPSAFAEDAPPPGDEHAPPPQSQQQPPPPPKRHAPDPKEMAAKMTEHLKRALDLNDDQAKKVQGVIERDATQKAELTKRLQAMERREHEDIRAVLNDEQKEKFDMMRAHQMMMGGMHGGMGGPGMGGAGMHGPRPGPGGDQGGGGRPQGGPEGGPNGNPPPPHDDSGD